MTLCLTDPFSTYGYDDDGQLISSLGYLSDGTPVAAEQLSFVYDAGFNITQRSVNGAATTYSVNDLNEVTGDGVNTYGYDNNGNRTSQSLGTGSYSYSYDDENRLISVATDTSTTPAASRWRTDFVYDGLGRLRDRKDYTWTGSPGDWAVSAETRYLYDGKRVVQERDASNTPTTTYTRGKDLSGSLEEAGGIGGLISRSYFYGSRHAWCHADGNGNVTYMGSRLDGWLASYKYDGYGRTISSSGSMAGANGYRFSSKEIHVNSGMYYYGYRFYDPNLQKWLNRDPLREPGFEALRAQRVIWPNKGPNLYEFVGNAPTEWCDPEGLTLYYCVRKSDFRLNSNHGYIFDDSGRHLPPSCGQSASSGAGQDKPPGNPDHDTGPADWSQACWPIPGTDPDSVSDLANSIWECCQNTANQGTWLPWRNDCFNKVDDCLRANNIHPPEHSRFGPPRIKPIQGGPIFTPF
jgi:RHS repeat-associated protein